MASFDLLTEPWIPVVERGSGEIREVGIREALTQAHTFREVQADTPLETVSINRLLLALWLRVFGKKTEREDEWFRFWGQRETGFGQEHIKAIETYFSSKAASGKFDLLHSIHPFYQYAGLPAYLDTVGSPSSIGRIFSDEASGNNPTLFSHEMDDVPREVPLPKAARGIVTTQATALQGGKSRPFYLADTPLVGGAIFWLRGESLYDAFLLNAPPSVECRMGSSRDNDRPAWEEESEVAESRPLYGYLDYLTFQSRRILLATQERSQGDSVATGVWISQGDKIDGRFVDPLMAFRVYEKSETGELAFKMRTDRALWRDSSIFLNLMTTKRLGTPGHAPRTFEWVASYYRKLGREMWQVDVFGMVNNKGALELWRHERMPIHVGYLLEQYYSKALETVLSQAEEQQQNLGRSCAVAAAALLFPAKGYKELKQIERNEARTLGASLGAEARYWAYLDLPFLQLFKKLPEIEETQIDSEIAEWEETIKKAAKRAFNEATRSLEMGSRNLKALAEGEKAFYPVKSYFIRRKQGEPE